MKTADLFPPANNNDILLPLEDLADDDSSSACDDFDIDEPSTTSLSRSLKFAASLTKPSAEEIKSKQIMLGPLSKKHTIVFDIDNTLLSANYVSSHKGTLVESIEITVRPYALQLLELMSCFYEIVLFTAGSESYAEKVKDCIDPDGKMIVKTLGSSSCILTEEGVYVKDLRIFADRNLKNIVIIDDKVTSFAFQLYNGIPVTPFSGEPGDDEFKFLITYLQELYEYEDLRHGNKKNIYDKLVLD